MPNCCRCRIRRNTVAVASTLENMRACSQCSHVMYSRRLRQAESSTNPADCCLFKPPAVVCRVARTQHTHTATMHRSVLISMPRYGYLFDDILKGAINRSMVERLHKAYRGGNSVRLSLLMPSKIAAVCQPFLFLERKFLCPHSFAPETMEILPEAKQ